MYDWSRSGAELASDRQARGNFVSTFPELFRTRDDELKFVAEEDEAAAHELYGEIPATFPTVRWQVRKPDARVGRDVDLALACGGGNDIGLETMFNPSNFSGEAGARRIADTAIQRLKDHESRVALHTAQEAAGAPAPVPGGPETIEQTLARYGQRGWGKPDADLGNLDVDSLAVWAVTARNSDRDMCTDVFLEVDTRTAAGRRVQYRYLLNMPNVTYKSTLSGWLEVRPPRSTRS